MLRRYTALITITWLLSRGTYGSRPADVTVQLFEPEESLKGLRLLNVKGVVFNSNIPVPSRQAARAKNATTSTPTEQPRKAPVLRKSGSFRTKQQAGNRNSTTLRGRGSKKAKNRCLSPDCSRMARFGFAKQVAVACSLHREATHVNVLDKCCQHIEGCPKRPAYGLPRDRVPLFCSQHKTGAHIDVRNRLCQYPDGCRVRPSYGSPLDRKPLFCFSHKLSWQEDVSRRRCEASLCPKRASYGAPGSPHARCCAQHKREGQVDVRHKKSPLAAPRPPPSHSDHRDKHLPHDSKPRRDEQQGSRARQGGASTE